MKYSDDRDLHDRFDDRTANHIAAIADELISAYTNLRRANNPRFVLDPKIWPRKMWERLAVEIFQLKADPKQFMELQFARLRPYPMPNQLFSDKVTRHYQAAVKGDALFDKAKFVVGYQVTLVKQNLDAGRTMREVLEEEMIPLNPVMLFSLAYTAGLTDLADRYQADAKTFLSTYPAYWKILEKYLPLDMNPCR
jgi:hypothetical protein